MYLIDSDTASHAGIAYAKLAWGVFSPIDIHIYERGTAMKNLRIKLGSVAAIATMALIPVAHAVDVTSNFDVTVSLTSVCEISTAPGTVAFTYTAFGAAANAGTSFGVRCTNNLGYTMALDAPVGGQTVGGLTYNLTLSSASGTGSGSEQSYNINGTMAAGQAGDSTASTTQTRTLTVTY